MNAEGTELPVTDRRPPGDVQPTGYTFASFWRRAAAFAVDCVVVSLLGQALGALEGGLFSTMRGWAPLVGLLLVLVYFGVPNSVLGGGQTLGKGLMGLRVVARDGACIGLARSLGRAALFGAPFIANRIWFPPSSSLLWPDFVRTGVVWVVGGTTLYLYLLNAPTHQTLHDIVCGTYVVRAASTGQISASPVAGGHLGVVFGWVLLVVVLHLGVAWQMANSGLYSELRVAQQAVAVDADVARVGFIYQRVHPGGQSVVVAQVCDAVPPISDDAQAREVARALITASPRAQRSALVEVRITTGWDIGLASYWVSHTMQDTPANWLTAAQPGRSAPGGR